MRSRKFIDVVLAAVILIAIILMVTVGSKGSISFRICFGALLALFACIQLYVAIALFTNRHNSLLELSQPIGLSLFAVAGSAASIGSLTLALPEYDVACALRQPIFTLVYHSWGPFSSQDLGG